MDQHGFAKDAIDQVSTGLFIDGEWVDASSGATLAVENPATGEELRQVADASASDGRAALDAAVAAQPSWGATSPRDRSQLLWRLFELIQRDKEHLAAIMTSEMGKPLAEARGEVDYGAEFIRWFAEEALRIEGDYVTPPDGKTRAVIRRRPVGPCLLITPWNFPLSMATRKLGAALAAGCTSVIKPAALTPLTTLKLAELIQEAGAPNGVVNVLTTASSGKVMGPLIASGLARKLSFTGSTEVGRQLCAQASETIMRTSMELGGNAPFLVFADADLAAAVDGAMVAKMRNMGEACVAANRFHVQASVADEFADRLADRMGALRVGNGLDDGVDVGPLIDEKAVDKVAELTEDTLAGGGRLLCGGNRIGGPGHFFAPTVVADVAPDARVTTEEVFGPLAAIIPFDDEDEAIAAANATPFGLAAYFYTSDLDRSWRVGEALQAGMVGLNTGLVSNPALPFGGVKQSGLGREGGHLGIAEYQDVQYVISPR